MAKKILVGMALVAILCAVGAAGFRLGKHLRQVEGAQASHAEPAAQAGVAQRAGG